MKEEETYIELFDSYHRNEIDYVSLVDACKRLNPAMDTSVEYNRYQTALYLLELHHMKSLAEEVVHSLSA